MIATAPAGYRTGDEFPSAEIPDIPLWSENYCYVAYDPAARIGVWTHLGRAGFDPTLWRELLIMFLPDGEMLMSKAYGRRPAIKGPAAAAMVFQCEEPWNRWTTRFDGAAVPATRDQLERSLLTDDVHVGAGFELHWEAHSPVWEMGEEMRQQSWGHLHYEQLCRVTGTVRHRDVEVAFDGAGLRDHTRGPRDFGPVERHCWLFGAFPSGRGFIVINAVAGSELRRGVIVSASGELTEAEVVQSPLLTSREQADDGYELILRTAAGDTSRIEAQLLRNFAGGFGLPNEVLFGYDPGRATHALFEGWARFRWDGEEGYGLTERTLRNPEGERPC